MKTPVFWQRRNWLSHILWPFSQAYGVGVFLHRAFAKPYRPKVPVICIGNLTAGGAGKTPLVRWLAQAIQHELQQTPHIVLRGYGGRITSPILVDSKQHTARDVGDEALLHAAHFPTWIGSNRAHVIQAAERAGASLILMDDGYQNPSIVPAQKWLVIDGAYGFGNGWLLPAGPLRQSAAEGLNQAQRLFIIGEPNAALASLLRDFATVPCHHVTSSLMAPHAATNTPLYLFAGIAHPHRFFADVRRAGHSIMAERSYADHYSYSRQERERLRQQATIQNARLATTAKDAMRWPVSERDDLLIFDKTVMLSPADTQSAIAAIRAYL
jgi:tetraacyldisaccharide 4'-kinase